jgi:hypothetical protein
MVPRMRPPFSRIPVFLLPLVMAACATGGRSSGNPFGRASGEQEIHIKVLNQNFYDATIWAVVRGARQSKLGVVVGKQDADFTMPWTFSEPLQLEIDLLTGNMRCRTDPLTVDPGDILELQISVDFGQTRGCSIY